ncbi:MAG: hypothetical protein K6T65_06770 [Peptococcaceae bacterium]|nr:hypothetical protein [Peptococcaceae bacterium]
MAKVKCNVCNKYKNPQIIKIINNKKYCNDCWKDFRKKNGFFEIGCINPAAVVCPDREPAIIKVEGDPVVEIDFKKAICYFSHEECMRRMKEDNRLLNNIVDRSFFCPVCESKLKIVKGSRTVAGVCLVHGIIFHGIINK